jgi:hypothetical protein
MLSKQLEIIKKQLKAKTSLTSNESQLLAELDYLDNLLKKENFPSNLLLDSVHLSNESRGNESLITTSGSKCPCCGR